MTGIIRLKGVPMLIFEAVTYEAAPREAAAVEEALIPRIAAGDRAAFSRLYEQASEAVFSYALSILRSRQDAEDVMQDAFLKIRSAAHLYVPQGKPLAWILTITRNLCMMKFRQASRIAALPEDPGLEDMGLDRIKNAEDRMTLQAAFTVLPKDSCRIIMLHAVAGLKHREIAELMGMSLTAVLSRYNRGIKRLQKELEARS